MLIQPVISRGSMFSSVWKVKFPRRLSSSCGKCCKEKLTPWTSGRGSLIVGPVYSILCRKTVEDLEHIMWSSDFACAVSSNFF